MKLSRILMKLVLLISALGGVFALFADKIADYVMWVAYYGL